MSQSIINFLSVKSTPPGFGTFVVVICKHGYKSPQYEFATAKRVLRNVNHAVEGWRWITPSNDDLNDRGLSPIFWAPIPILPPDYTPLEELEEYVATLCGLDISPAIESELLRLIQAAKDTQK